MIICARVGCDNEFSRKAHNQKYCSDECCRLATNKRIMSNYYKEKARIEGKPRICEKCEITKLSRYNASSVCSSCASASEVSANKSVIDMLTNASIAS